MPLHVKPGTAWSDWYARARAAAPEAFDAQSLRNLMGGEWVAGGATRPHALAIDGSHIVGAPVVDSATAHKAMAMAVKQDFEWSRVPLDERMRRVAKAVALLREQRDTIAGLLMWEIGKPWKLACDDVDRCLDGVEWYLTQIERQLAEGFAKRTDGKGRADFDVAPTVSVVVGDDLDACRRPVKEMMALYIGGMGARDKNFYNRYARDMGYEAAAQSIQDLFLGGRKEEAVAAVQTAVQARPNYKVALQNLGDLYTALAQQAYGQAKNAGNGNGLLPLPKPAAQTTTTTNTRTLR